MTARNEIWGDMTSVSCSQHLVVYLPMWRIITRNWQTINVLVQQKMCLRVFFGTGRFITVRGFVFRFLNYYLVLLCWNRSARTVLCLTEEFHLDRIRVSIRGDVMLFSSAGILVFGEGGLYVCIENLFLLSWVSVLAKTCIILDDGVICGYWKLFRVDIELR